MTRVYLESRRFHIHRRASNSQLEQSRDRQLNRSSSSLHHLLTLTRLLSLSSLVQVVFKQEADSFPPLVQLEQCSPPHTPDTVNTTFRTEKSSAERHSDPHAANRSMKATYTGSGTTTGSDIILAGQHLQVAVEKTEAEKVRRERTDRRSTLRGETFHFLPTVSDLTTH